MKRLLQNFNLKIWALGIAVVLWFHVKTEKRYEESFQIPIAIPEQENELVQINPVPGSYTFLLRGTGKVLLRMRWFSKMKAIVKLPPVKKGKRILELSAENVTLDPSRDVEIVLIDPPEILLEFDQLERKRVRVSPQIEGKPRKGFMWTGEVALSPSTVDLWGGKSKLDATDSLLTEMIDLSNREKSFIIHTPVLLPPAAGFRIDPDSVRASLTIEEIVERSFTDIPIRILNKPTHWKTSLNPEKGDLVLSGPKNKIKSIQNGDLFITLNLKGKKRGKFELPPSFDPPSGITVVSTSPEVFTVTLE